MEAEIMDNNIQKISKLESKCTGCGACVNICPRNAIQLKERDGYFLFPEVDETKCNHCGLCLKKCPATIPAAPSEGVKNGFPRCYGAFAQDAELRQRSSSGGAFSILANWMLSRGGVVCGAAFTSGCECNHIIVTKQEDLAPLRGSKYLQSNPGFVYREVAKFLKNKVSVLFVGTPCQVAACNAVVGDGGDNLVTVDLLCAGVPPQRLFKEFVDCLTDGHANEVCNVKMRDKSLFGWHSCCCCCFDLGGQHFSFPKTESAYFRGMKARLLARRSCWNCRFSRFPRQGDLTIGDLWDVAEKKLHIKDEKGVSVVCVNTSKGAQILGEIKQEFALLKKVPIADVSGTNNLQSHCYPHPNYERFWQWLKGTTQKNLLVQKIDEYISLSNGVAVLNFHNGRGNYGCALTGYAMQEKIRQMIGFAPVHICLNDGFGEEVSDLRDFTKEFVLETSPGTSSGHLRSLNRYFQTFIVGPDVVWKNSAYYRNFYMFLLDFAAFSKNICSYAPSFKFKSITNFVPGKGQVEASVADLKERKRLMKRFAHISVREDFGVKLCKEVFDVDAKLVLDPTLLLEAKDYEPIMQAFEGSDDVDSNTIVTYFLNRSNVPRDVEVSIREYGKVKDLVVGSDYSGVFKREQVVRHGVRMCDWLRGIRDCKCLLTDSYHGMIFAIIFRRPFVLFRHLKSSGTVSYKLEALLELLGIGDRFVNSQEDFKRLLSEGLDYSRIEPRLAEWKSRSERYLAEVLADNKPNPTRQWMESLEIQHEQLADRVYAPVVLARKIYWRARGIAGYVLRPRRLLKRLGII